MHRLTNDKVATHFIYICPDSGQIPLDIAGETLTIFFLDPFWHINKLHHDLAILLILGSFLALFLVFGPFGVTFRIILGSGGSLAYPMSTRVPPRGPKCGISL